MTRTLLAMMLAMSSAHAVPVIWSKPDTVHGFGGWRDELQSITDRFGKTRIAHFCIVVRTTALSGQQDRTALVYWKEEHTIQGYGESADNRMTPDLQAGAEHIDLRDGLVDRAEQIGGSTVLETRAHANDIIKNCRVHGTTLTLMKEARHGSR